MVWFLFCEAKRYAVHEWQILTFFATYTCRELIILYRYKQQCKMNIGVWICCGANLIDCICFFRESLLFVFVHHSCNFVGFLLYLEYFFSLQKMYAVSVVYVDLRIYCCTEC